MAYKDISATEARGMWSPPNGASPQMIPDYWISNPEESARTDLPDKTDAELVSLGWKKVDMPSYSTYGVAYFNNTYSWNESTRTYDATELDRDQKLGRMDYDIFWEAFQDSDVYATIKTASSTSLLTNTLFTEFNSIFEDAKRGRVRDSKIQTSINELFGSVSLTTEERDELQTLFDSTGMSSVYTI